MTCVSNIKLRDLVGLVQDNLRPEAIGAVNTLNGEATNLSLSGDIKLDEQAVEALCQQLEGCLGADPKYNGGRATNFVTKENTLEIVLADGTVLDLTHKELTDWLAGKDSALATGVELHNTAELLRGEFQEADDILGERIEEVNQQALKIDDIKLSNGYIAYYEQ